MDVPSTSRRRHGIGTVLVALVAMGLPAMRVASAAAQAGRDTPAAVAESLIAADRAASARACPSVSSCRIFAAFWRSLSSSATPPRLSGRPRLRW